MLRLKTNAIKYKDATGTMKNSDVLVSTEVRYADGTEVVTPTIDIEEIEGGTKVTITDLNGAKTFEVMDGKDGADGKDGKDGEDGKDGVDGKDGADGKDAENILPAITEADEGKVLMVVNGAYAFGEVQATTSLEPAEEGAF